MDAVVGRDALLDDAFAALTQGRAVVLEGPAGIGKTAMHRALLDRVTASGTRVLACAPTESETALPLAAVADLLLPLDGGFDSLPEAQARAARAAVTGEPEVDERALSAALRALLDGAAEQAPLLVAVDDVPWLDPPSERALRFALRRLNRPVGVLLTRRTAELAGDPAPLGLADVERIVVPPLGVGALHHVVHQRLGVSVSRPLVARLTRDSGGNALLAIEMARAVLRLPELPGPGDDLPVVTSVHNLVAATLGGLDDRCRQAVRSASLLATPTTAVLVQAGFAVAELDPAEEAGLLAVLGDGEVEFAHPVYAAAVRASIPSGVRRRLHEALAGIVADPDERARQLARSRTAPDDAAAGELEAAAERARGRGAPEIAADLYERAVELTVDRTSEDAYRRRLTAIRCRFDSGDYSVAGPQAEAVAAELSGPDRADAMLLHAVVAWSSDDTGTAVRVARQALDAADPRSRLAGSIHAHLAVFIDVPGPAREHADAARRLLASTGATEPGRTAAGLLASDDEALLASALMSLFFNEVRTGQPPRLDLLDEALRLEGPDEPSWLAGTIPAIWWKSMDDRDRAVERLNWMLDRAAARGDEPFQHEVITHLGDAELFAGRYEPAARWIAAARTLGEQLDTGLGGESWLAGMLAAYTGRTDEAAAVAAEGLRIADAAGEQWLRRINLHLAGVAAICAGRWADAAAAFADLADEVDEMGLVEPLGSRFESDWVEAAVASGDLDTAVRAQERLRARNDRLPRPWTTLGVARGAVLIAGASSAPVDDAIDELLAARDAVPADVVPLDRARCLLVAGQAQRRARRKAPARELLTAAVAEFDALGAASFAARARAELARVGAARAASSDALTETESRVAELAAMGRTNRAIADELFVSPKTVEANLARIYRKLRISGRVELGPALAAREG